MQSNVPSLPVFVEIIGEINDEGMITIKIFICFLLVNVNVVNGLVYTVLYLVQSFSIIRVGPFILLSVTLRYFILFRYVRIVLSISNFARFP